MIPSATGDVLIAGPAVSATALVLRAPISFWGGIDPANGNVIDVRHPDHGSCIAGTALFLPGTIGSSSASSVMLELVLCGKAPAAIMLSQPDAILTLGLVVAREMGWTPPLALRLAEKHFDAFAGKTVSVGGDGTVTAT